MRRVVLVLCVCVMGTIAQADIVTQPYIAGDFNGWSPGVVPMVSLGGGIWEYTISGLDPNQYQQFKITDENTSWGVTAPADNSWYNADASGEVTITFNTNIVSDGWLPEQFRVGVSTEPGSWSLCGDFNGWATDDPAQLMTAQGGGIYAITQTFAAGTYYLKPVKTGSYDGIGTDGRSKDAWNYELTLASATEVTVYVDAFTGTMGIGGDVTFGRAHDPVPANGEVVGSSLATLSWTNPDPNDPNDPITSDVYFLDAGTAPLAQDPNMGPDVNDPGVVQIANDITAETVATPALVDDHYYYWAVHVTDPTADPNGDPLTTQGYTWYFYTGDAAPVPGQPVDQYMWLAQDDSAVGGIGDTNPNVRYFEVTASYTDDDKSTVVDANFVNLNWDWANGELGIEEVSDVHNPATKTVTAVYRTIYEEGGDPNNTTELPGYWQIRLEVTDGTGMAHGTPGIHRIFETCLEAAAADPDDTFASLSNDIIIGLGGAYDTNGDCIINLEDFADFAKAWLDQSVKYE